MLASRASIGANDQVAYGAPVIVRLPVDDVAFPNTVPGRQIADCRSLADLKSWLLAVARGSGFYGGRYVHLGHGAWGSDRYGPTSAPTRRPAGGGEMPQPTRFMSTSAGDVVDGKVDDWLNSDPAVGRVRTAFAPFSWSTRIQPGDTAVQRAWLDGERARGVGAGIAVPVQDYSTGPAYLSLFGTDEAAALRLIDARSPELAFIGAQFHARAKLLVPTTDGLATIANLTRREVECLTLAGLGHTVVESGRALLISGRTVEFHLRNAGEKLGATTKLRAVALAVGCGLIQI